jgi:hypothetical protein
MNERCTCMTEPDRAASDSNDTPSSAADPSANVNVPNATTVAICLGERPSIVYARNRIAPPLRVFTPTLWPIA